MPVNVPNAQTQPTAIFGAMDQILFLSDPCVHITMGLSNISQGTKQKSLIDSVFLSMSVSHGCDSAIADVFDKKLMDIIATAEMLMNKQIYSDSYLKVY